MRNEGNGCEDRTTPVGLATTTGLASLIKDSSISKDGGTRKMVNYA